MSSITPFYITRQTTNQDPFEISYSQSAESRIADLKISESPLARNIDEFFRRQQHFLECIGNSPNLVTLPSIEEDQDLKSIMQKTHSIPLTKEDISNIVDIWKFLKTIESIQHLVEQVPARFKIKGLCSITLHKKDLFIHLKKAKTKCILGSGIRFKAHRSIHISEDSVSLIAELTNNNEFPSTPRSATSLSLSDVPEFLTAPLLEYSYEGHFKKRPLIKECAMYPLYETDFSTILNYHAKKPILSNETQWKMLSFLIRSLNIIHGRNLVYRDLKLENCFLAVSTTADNRVDFNNCTFALGDFDTTAEESAFSRTWVGTEENWPPQKDSRLEKQKKPADIYALGVLTELIFEISHATSKEEVDFIDSLFSSMTQDAYRNRPTITKIASDVEAFLMKHHPEYSWIPEFFPH